MGIDLYLTVKLLGKIPLSLDGLDFDFRLTDGIYFEDLAF